MKPFVSAVALCFSVTTSVFADTPVWPSRRRQWRHIVHSWPVCSDPSLRVDTPEGKQTCEDATGKRYLCGSRAADALSALIGRNGRVSCEEEDRDRYGRIVAVCQANGRGINAELIRQGWALEYNQYSDGRYAGHEAEARKAKRGLWAGKFVEPWDWRRGERLTSEASTGSDRKCAIKGNISSSGKIYHMPGSRSYPTTNIDEAIGECWFCTEEEARAAG